MKTRVFLTLLVAGMGLITQCKKDNTSFNTYFWTTDSYTASNSIYLYVNGTNEGVLPSINVSCSNLSDSIVKGGEPVTLRQAALNITLRSGTYKVEERDSKGHVLSSSVLSMCNSLSNSSNGGGGMCAQQQGKDLYVNIFQ